MTPAYTLGRTHLASGRPGHIGICQQCAQRSPGFPAAGMVQAWMGDHAADCIGMWAALFAEVQTDDMDIRVVDGAETLYLWPAEEVDA